MRMVFAKDEEYKEKGCSEISFFELVRLIEIFRRPHFLYKHTFYLPPPPPTPTVPGPAVCRGALSPTCTALPPHPLAFLPWAEQKHSSERMSQSSELRLKPVLRLRLG